MNNTFYKQSKYDDVNINLYDYVHSYIENCNAISDGSEIIYNLCVDYHYGSITAKQREILVNFFSIY